MVHCNSKKISGLRWNRTELIYNELFFFNFTLPKNPITRPRLKIGNGVHYAISLLRSVLLAERLVAYLSGSSKKQKADC